MTGKRKGSGWTGVQNQLATVLIGAMATLLVGGVTFYFTTTANDTKHDEAIKTLGASIQDLSKTLADRFQQEAAQRAALSKQFLEDTKATNTGIADLNKQIAVQTSVLQVMGRAVEKLEQRIDAATSVPVESRTPLQRR